MQEKNKSNFHDVLNIDLITKNGNVKYNLTATPKISRMMSHAEVIIILVHGFMESSQGFMVNAIAPELLKKPEFKVFALDGRKIINLEYFSSTTNVRFMGELLGTFLADVIKREYTSILCLHYIAIEFSSLGASQPYSSSSGTRRSRARYFGPIFVKLTDFPKSARSSLLLLVFTQPLVHLRSYPSLAHGIFLYPYGPVRHEWLYLRSP